MSQVALAKAVGVSQSTVSDWLTKGTMPNGDVVIALVKVLRISADWLLLGRGARAGGPAPAVEAFADGGLGAFAEMRRALDTLEANWRKVSPELREFGRSELEHERLLSPRRASRASEVRERTDKAS